MKFILKLLLNILENKINKNTQLILIGTIEKYKDIVKVLIWEKNRGFKISFRTNNGFLEFKDVYEANKKEWFLIINLLKRKI